MLTDDEKKQRHEEALASRKAARLAKEAEARKKVLARAAEELPEAMKAVSELVGEFGKIDPETGAADPIAFVQRAEELASARPGKLAELESMNMALGRIQKTALALRLALRPIMDQRAALENAERKLGRKGFEQLKQTLGIGGKIADGARVRQPATETE